MKDGDVPTCRGYLDVDEDRTARNEEGLLPDSYLNVAAWSKGLAFVNGFNLGWYWPSQGPANTMCAPPASLLLSQAARESSLYVFMITAKISQLLAMG